MALRWATLRDIPRSEIATMVWRLALSQAPFHRPERQHLPAFSAQWYEAEARGQDITHWYSVPGKLSG